MKEVKATTKADIEKYTIELGRLKGLLEGLIKQQTIINGMMGVTFSNDFKEFYNSSQYMKTVNEEFKKGQFDIIRLLNNINDLIIHIQPGITNDHWEDLEDPYYKP
jgi:hypothetical protein